MSILLQELAALDNSPTSVQYAFVSGARRQ